MPEIENVTFAGAITGENVLYFRADPVRRPEENARVQVSLQCDSTADAGACCTQIGRPIEADGVGTYCRNVVEPCATAFCEHDDGYPALARCASQVTDDLAHVR